MAGSCDKYCNYQEEACLGTEVWKGEYNGKKVAIKTMKEIKSAQATQQFLAEAFHHDVRISHLPLVSFPLSSLL